jgi:hypothetical protein
VPSLSEKLPQGKFTWTQFEEDGTERQRAGLVWAHGPIVSGRGTLWVVPDDHEQKIVLVTQAPQKKFAYAGRTWEHQAGDPTWEPCGGRVIKPGEWYSETHDLSQTGSITQSVNRTSQRA